MAERITIARPYAKAIFAQALAAKRLEAWSAVLQNAAAISSDARVKTLFGNPHVSSEQLAAFYTDIGGEGLDGDARNLLATLAANRRLGYLPEIAKSYEQFRAEHERVIDVTVTSAVELSPQQRERLTAACAKRLDREVRLHTELNPALLGGAVLRAGDLVIDGSLATGLQQLSASVVAG